MATRRRRTTTRKTSGVRSAARDNALKDTAAAHHSRKLSLAFYRARGGTSKSDGKAYAQRHRLAANRRHKVRKHRMPLDGLFGPSLNPLRWLTAKPGYFKRKR
jgi:hypothetical protein